MEPREAMGGPCMEAIGFIASATFVWLTGPCLCANAKQRESKPEVDDDESLFARPAPEAGQCLSGLERNQIE